VRFGVQALFFALLADASEDQHEDERDEQNDQKAVERHQ